MEVVLEQFLDEARELLGEAGSGLLALERAPSDAQVVNTVFRAFHTMKGSSALFDLRPMTRTLHAAEDLLHAVREGHSTFSADMADLLLTVLDQVSAWLSSLASGAALDAEADERADQLVERAREIGGDTVGAVAAPSKPELVPAQSIPTWLRLAAGVPEFVGRQLIGVEYDPDPSCFFGGDDPLRLMSLLPELVSLRIVGADELRAQEQPDPFQCGLRFRAVTAASIEQVRTLFAYVTDQVKLYEFSVGLGPEVEPCVRVLTEVASSLSVGVPAELAATRRAAHVQLVGNVLSAAGFPEVWTSTFSEMAERALGAESDSLLQTAVERVLATIAAAGRCGMRLSMMPQAHKMARLSAQPIGTPSLRASLAQLAGAEPLLVAPAPVIGRVEPRAADSTGQAARKEGERSQVYKVDQARIDALLDLAGELLVTKNALPYLARRAEANFGAPALAREIKEQGAALSRLADSFHHAVMQLRIIPVGHVFERFPRLVRDLSRQLGKQVRLELQGAETEADKSMVEKLADPLIHIVRNSLDHGLETSEERVASEKPVESVVRLRARQERGALVVSVEDDGKGIDPVRIRATAVRRGVLTQDEAASLSDEDAINLIFRAGFSTKEQISDLSGRGVGMDVVQSTLRAVKGSVRVISKVGSGTTVTLTMPLSMAVTRVLLVEVQERVFGVPFESVTESVHVQRSAIARVKNHDVVTIRERAVPIVHLSNLLGLAAPERLQDRDGPLTVLLVRLPVGEVGLVVDGLHEAVDIMLKPLEGPLAGLRGYLGASLLGDGRALLVLSLIDLFDGP